MLLSKFSSSGVMLAATLELNVFLLLSKMQYLFLSFYYLFLNYSTYSCTRISMMTICKSKLCIVFRKQCLHFESCKSEHFQIFDRQIKFIFYCFVVGSSCVLCQTRLSITDFTNFFPIIDNGMDIASINNYSYHK